MLVLTTKGEMDERLLEKKEGPGWVEYYLNGELVHRSACVTISGVEGKGIEGDCSGGPVIRS